MRRAAKEADAAARAAKEAEAEAKRRAARRAKLLSKSGASTLAAKEEFDVGLKQASEMSEEDRAMGHAVMKSMIEPQMLAQCESAPGLFEGAEQQVLQKADAGELTDPSMLGILRSSGKAKEARVAAGSSAGRGGVRRGKGSKKGGMAQAIVNNGDRFRAERLLRPYYLSREPAAALAGREAELDDALAELRLLEAGAREALARLRSTDMEAHGDTYECLAPFYGEARKEMCAEMSSGLGALEQITENPDLFVKPLLRTMFTAMMARWCPDIEERVALLEAKLTEVEALAEAAALKRERARAKKARQKLKKQEGKETQKAGGE